MLGLARSLHPMVQYLKARMAERRGGERGQTLLEYLVIGGVVAIVVLLGIAFYADEVQDWFVSIGNWVEGGATPVGPSFSTGSAAPTPD